MGNNDFRVQIMVHLSSSIGRVKRKRKKHSAAHGLRVQRGAHPDLAELVAGLASGGVLAVGDASSGAAIVIIARRVVDRVGRALGRHELHGLEARHHTEVLLRKPGGGWGQMPALQ